MAEKPKITEETIRFLFELGYWMIDIGQTDPNTIKLTHKKGFNVYIPMSKAKIVVDEAAYAVTANAEIMGNYFGKQIFPKKFEIKLQTEPDLNQ